MWQNAHFYMAPAHHTDITPTSEID